MRLGYAVEQRKVMASRRRPDKAMPNDLLKSQPFQQVERYPGRIHTSADQNKPQGRARHVAPYRLIHEHAPHTEGEVGNNRAWPELALAHYSHRDSGDSGEPRQ